MLAQAANAEIFTTKPIAIEQWKPVLGWEGIYEVSDMGRVKRVLATMRGAAGRCLNPITNPDGYFIVHLCNGPRKKTGWVHRLVLDAFVGPRELEVNHKNGNKKDNWLENLEWVTRSQNCWHNYNELGRERFYGEKNGRAKTTWETARTVRLRRESGATLRSIAKEFGLHVSCVAHIVAGRTWRE